MCDINNELFCSFKSFLTDIKPLIISDNFDNYYNVIFENESINEESMEIVNSFINQINGQIDDIIAENSDIFKNISLKYIDLDDLWNNTFTDDMKETVWTYFQTFSIIYINLNSSNELQLLLKGIKGKKKNSKKDINDLKQIKLLKAKINEKAEPTESNLFDSTTIGNLAQEVAKSIDIPSLMGNITETDNPNDILNNLLQPDKFANIFSTINQSIQDTMHNYDEGQLEDEANKLFPMFKDNPILQSINNMNNNTTNTNNHTANTNNGTTNDTTNGTTNDNNSKNINIHSNSDNKTKQRLQKKLNDRKQKTKITVNKDN